MEITKLDDDIILIKNMLSQPEIDYLLNFINKSSESDWGKFQSNYQGESIWKNRILVLRELSWILESDFKILNDMQSRIILFSNLILNKEYSMRDGVYNLSRSLPGQGMGVHTDDDHDITKWGIVVYLNDDYVGGEIFYPDKNIEIKPIKGSMVIHKSTIKHGVKEVSVGTRYFFTSFLDDIVV